MLVVVWLNHDIRGVIQNCSWGIWYWISLKRIFQCWIFLSWGKNVAKHSFGWLSRSIKLVIVPFLGRILYWDASICCLRHFKNVVHVSHSDFSASIRRHRPLLIFLESHVIIFDSFCKVSPLVLASTSSISGIDMIRIDLKNCCEIINALLELPNLFECASSYVVSPSILGVKMH
jgi:hypothetical protein